MRSVNYGDSSGGCASTRHPGNANARSAVRRREPTEKGSREKEQRKASPTATTDAGILQKTTAERHRLESELKDLGKKFEAIQSRVERLKKLRSEFVNTVQSLCNNAFEFVFARKIAHFQTTPDAVRGRLPM